MSQVLLGEAVLRDQRVDGRLIGALAGGVDHEGHPGGLGRVDHARMLLGPPPEFAARNEQHPVDSLKGRAERLGVVIIRDPCAHRLRKHGVGLIGVPCDRNHRISADAVHQFGNDESA